MAIHKEPTHPGEVLRKDVLIPLGLTMTEAARRLGVSRRVLSALVNCEEVVKSV
ncbi:MAG: hypothetical protein HYW07_14430 [Candidatus Latescibacteria bacterium]|nr:hypothetical protein [Candidatus Latescibacterota bacterium]